MSRRSTESGSAPDEVAPPRTWLTLLYQLPPRSATARVKAWRRLQQVGAVSLRNAAYVLPDSAQGREDLEWVKSEIVSMGGQATILAASAVDDATDGEIARAFRQPREAEYRELLHAVAALERRVASRSDRRRQPDPPALRRALRACRDRLAEIQAVDFFSAPGRREAEAALGRLEGRVAGKAASDRPAGREPALQPRDFQRRIWVTRPGPGVDRMASAWLIRTFIDPRAVFAFSERPTGRQVPFDMFEGAFGHRAGLCTFETLTGRFRIADPAVRRIGEIVHDLDLKDARYGAPGASTVGALVEGLRRAHADDRTALERGMDLFDALWRSMTPMPSARSAAGVTQRPGAVDVKRRPAARAPRRRR